MDLEEPSIRKEAITLVSSVMIRSMVKESKFRIPVVFMKELGKTINLFSNDRSIK